MSKKTDTMRYEIELGSHRDVPVRRGEGSGPRPARFIVYGSGPWEDGFGSKIVAKRDALAIRNAPIGLDVVTMQDGRVTS